ncbi:unnamed protein product [Cuscuta europaea]|uniref:DUF4378 domain-containing protein n=1 Tax=Cuscuta europaea TaxID=41803 RepID=A0A9P0ZET7_CUSEU|nr:unnamed protein product [Cuscuta europaea]
MQIYPEAKQISRIRWPEGAQERKEDVKQHKYRLLGFLRKPKKKDHLSNPRSHLELEKPNNMQIPESDFEPPRQSFWEPMEAAKEAKAQIFEMWKMTEGFQEVEVVSGKSTLEDMFSPSNSVDGDKKRESEYPLGISSKDGWKKKPLKKKKKKKKKSKASQYSWCLWPSQGAVRDFSKFNGHSEMDDYPETDESEREMALEKIDMHAFSKRNSCLLYGSSDNNNNNSKRLAPSFVQKDAVRQDLFQGSQQDRSVALKGTRIERDSMKILNEANQTSPTSVLEPLFQGPSTECYDSLIPDYHSLEPQPQLHETISWDAYSGEPEIDVSSNEDTNKETILWDTYSDEPEIDVSSDEDTKEESASGFSQHHLGAFIEEESSSRSRDYSYLVDVLDESPTILKLQGIDSLECPISSLVFERLENKYGKHNNSWPKWGRRLLFDRINASLSELLHSYYIENIFHHEAKSLNARYDDGLMLGRNNVEEQLWRLLLVDDGGAKGMCYKDLPQKAVLGTKWWKLESEISSVCQEIEDCIFEELASELVLNNTCSSLHISSFK